MAAVLLAAAGIAFTPAGLFGGGSPPATTTAVKLVHLLCFATSWGATVWAVFISGVIMFLNLPRHAMGRLRAKVFPAWACFALTAACTAAFAWLHLVFTPKTLEVMRERHKVERVLGLGGVSSFDGIRGNARAAANCAALAAHALSVLATIATAAGLAAHSCYLTGKLAL